MDAVPGKDSPAGLTLAIINYNGREVLPATLEAARGVAHPRTRILLVDDGSSDGSVEWVREHFPEVEVIAFAENGKKPSRARNRALREARTRYVLLLDNDVALDPGCPGALLRVMRERPGVLCCTPRLLYASDPSRIYYDGSDLHFLCVSTNTARGEPLSARRREEPFPTIPGGIGLVDRERALEVGLFDEQYEFGWGEDAELFIRGRLYGYRSLHVPAAVARHVERNRGLQRAEAQIYNRYRMLLTMYQARTLLFAAPLLLLFEAALLAMAATKGLRRAYLRSLLRLLRNRQEIRHTRQRIQSTRRISDVALLAEGDLHPTGALRSSRLISASTALLQRLFTPYWRLARRVLVLSERKGVARHSRARGLHPPASREAPESWQAMK